MMTRGLAALAMTALVGTGAQAATVWQGDVVIDSATGQCTGIPSAGVRTDSVLRAVLQPKNLSGNTANTIISFISNDILVFAMVIDHGAMPAGTAAAFGNTSSGLIKANVGTPYSQFEQNPTSIAANTEHVTLRGKINDFLFVANCDVTFRAAFTKRK
jgi:hypothetical protein